MPARASIVVTTNDTTRTARRPLAAETNMSVTGPQSSSCAPKHATVARRLWLYAAWVLASALLFSSPLSRFVRHAVSDDNASHTILIPAICAWLIYLERHRIFSSVRSDARSSLAFLLTALGA